MVVYCITLLNQKRFCGYHVFGVGYDKIKLITTPVGTRVNKTKQNSIMGQGGS
jgi:hypothetical protein